MISQLMLVLLATALVSSAAVAIVGVLRIPFRRVLGARTAYWLWMLVPGSAAAPWVPASIEHTGMAVSGVPRPVGHALSSAVMAFSGTQASYSDLAVELAVWLAGIVAMSLLAVRRHRALVRSLGRLIPRADGTYRSESSIEPMLVGALRPRIVLPADFEVRYTPGEAVLVLAHERAHIRRGDAWVSMLAMGWLCVFWFNPLMYWAVGQKHNVSTHRMRHRAHQEILRKSSDLPAAPGFNVRRDTAARQTRGKGSLKTFY